MVSESINAVFIDLTGDIDENGDNSDDFFSKPLSSRGFTKDDAISVENYDCYRHLHLLFPSSQPQIKSEDPICINPKVLEEGESSKPPTFDCEVCVEPKPVTESFKIAGCSHFYCNDCISQYVAAKLQDNIILIKCPVSNCSGEIDPTQCRLFLPEQVFSRWGDALCEALMKNSKRFYCPFKDCSALLFLDENEKTMKESECPHCNRKVCVECGTKWHPEITCAEFQKLAEDEREKDDVLLKKLAENNKWRRCPSCKFFLENNF